MSAKSLFLQQLLHNIGNTYKRSWKNIETSCALATVKAHAIAKEAFFLHLALPANGGHPIQPAELPAGTGGMEPVIEGWSFTV